MTPLEEGRAGVAERLGSRRAEIEEAIFARVSDGVFDPAGSGDAEYVAGLRAAMAAVLDYGLTGIEPGGESSAAVPSAAIAQARRAARGGVGLDTVLRRYIAGYAVLEGFIMQEADHSDLRGERTTQGYVLETSALLLDRLTRPSPAHTCRNSSRLEAKQASHERRRRRTEESKAP